MQNSFTKFGSTAMLTGLFLATITMVLHPVGGSFEHLLEVRNMIVITHSIAIISVPLLIIGCWSITVTLNQGNPLSLLAFLYMLIALIAVAFAAGINGLALPFYLDQIDFNTHDPEVSWAVLNYSFSLNKTMDYIFMGGSCLAISGWSLVNFKEKKFSPLFTWSGWVLSLIAVLAIFSGFGFTSLTGFRIFMTGFIVWMALSGILLRKA